MSNKKMFQKVKRYKAVIIGAGRIAAFFDDVKSKEVLTHAHAYFLNPRIELAGIYDLDFAKANSAAKKWSTKSYKNLDEMLKKINPEIVSICTPDEQHFPILEKIIFYKPKLVICEKPITTKIIDTRKIINLYKKNNIPILVNYLRRFDKTVQKFRKDLLIGKYGKVIAATGIYSKGMIHNGSHLIDIALFLFGKNKTAKALSSIEDFSKVDHTVSGFLIFENCPQFHLVATDQNNFFMFELDIICEKGRFNFVDEGFSLVFQCVEDDKMFDGYKVLSLPKTRKTKLNCAMSEMVKNAVDCLDFNTPLYSTADNALAAQIICTKLLK